MASARESHLIELALRKNPRFEESESQKEARYFLVVSSRLLKNTAPPRIPVYWGQDPHPDIIRKEVFRCSVLGKVIEKANLPSLMQAVSRTLGEASSGASLPSHMLSAGPDGPLAVYSGAGRVGTSLGSTPIQASNIVELWLRVGEQLAKSRKIQDANAIQILTVGDDLTVFPQAALLHHPPLLCLPVLQEAAGEGLVYTFIERQRVAEGRSDVGLLENVLGLWQKVAKALVHSGKLREPGELHIAHLRTPIWDAQMALAPTSYCLTYLPAGAGPRPPKISLAVFEREGAFLAALPAGEDGRTVFISSDIHRLADCAGKELLRRRQIEASMHLVVETVRRSR